MNAAYADGGTPLHYASQYGYIEIVRLLLAAGSVINHVATDGETALRCAAERNKVEVVRLVSLDCGNALHSPGPV